MQSALPEPSPPRGAARLRRDKVSGAGLSGCGSSLLGERRETEGILPFESRGAEEGRRGGEKKGRRKGVGKEAGRERRRKRGWEEGR